MFLFLESRGQPQRGTGTRAGQSRGAGSQVPGHGAAAGSSSSSSCSSSWCCRPSSVAVGDGVHVEEANVHLGLDVDALPHLPGAGAERGRGPHPAPCARPAPGTAAEMSPTFRKSSKVMPSYTWSGPCRGERGNIAAAPGGWGRGGPGMSPGAEGHFCRGFPAHAQPKTGSQTPTAARSSFSISCKDRGLWDALC